MGICVVIFTIFLFLITPWIIALAIGFTAGVFGWNKEPDFPFYFAQFGVMIARARWILLYTYLSLHFLFWITGEVAKR